MSNEKLTLHTDKYQINHMYSHWKRNRHNQVRVFDAYFRKIPFGNGFAVFAGLERIVEYINSLKFSESDIDYLRTQPEKYDEAFLEELKSFRFTGEISAVKEGTLVFANQPLVRVRTRLFEVQLVETAILNFMNYQTLIATKAARICQIAPNDSLMEFGTRRAQEADAAIWGARAAYIAGFDGTSNLKAGKKFNIPALGTHAHAFVQDYDTELEAFQAFAEDFPENAILLVDTYNTLKSGVPNAIIVGKEMEKRGQKLKGIRLDSGDLAYLSIKAREMLDEAGLDYVKIVASNDLDENVVLNLKMQGAKIDSWGIGTQLITAADNPSLGGVYKLVAKEKEDGTYTPVIKLSENAEKVTTPGFKEVYRIINNKNHKTEGDYIALADEAVENQKELIMFDPVNTWKKKKVKNFTAVRLLTPIFTNGEQVYELPTIEEIRKYHKEQLSLFWEQHLRKLNPQHYYVDLSQKLWDMKMQLIESHRNE